MSQQPAASLDHLVVIGPDLDSLRADWSALGFQLSPRGAHKSLGTANHTAMFADGTYLELLSVVRPGPANQPFQTALARYGVGVGGMAIKTNDAKAYCAGLAGGRLRPEPPLRFSRQVDTAEGPQLAVFTIVRLAEDSLPLPSVFACQHHTPELVWRRELLEHPNGVRGLAWVVFEADDPAAAAAAFAESMGAVAGPLGRGHTIFAPGPFLGFLKPTDGSAVGPTRVSSLGFEVSDIARLEAALDAGGAAHARTLTGDVVAPADRTQGFECLFTIERSAARAPLGASRSVSWPSSPLSRPPPS